MSQFRSSLKSFQLINRTILLKERFTREITARAQQWAIKCHVSGWLQQFTALHRLINIEFIPSLEQLITYLRIYILILLLVEKRLKSIHSSAFHSHIYTN